MKGVLSVVFALAVCVAAHAQMNEEKPTGPVISFERTQHDFGEVAHKTPKVECRFSFVNDGTGPLVITRVLTSCNCVKATFPKKPVAPGEHGEIVVIYEVSKKESGVFRKIVDVYSNAPEKRHSLVVKGVAVE